jgi:hypothetical protein
MISGKLGSSYWDTEFLVHLSVLLSRRQAARREIYCFLGFLAKVRPTTSRFLTIALIIS